MNSASVKYHDVSFVNANNSNTSWILRKYKSINTHAGDLGSYDFHTLMIPFRGWLMKENIVI